MIVESLAVATVVKTFYSVDKAMKIDEKALKRYAEAFEREEDAALLVKKKSELMDKRLENVAKKKRSIIKNTIPKFVDVYGKIQKIQVSSSKEKLVLVNLNEGFGMLQAMSMSYKKDFTDKELVCGLLTNGPGKMIEKDSERYLSAANNQLSEANVIYKQAENVAAVYDAIIKRADDISNLLMRMNALFVRLIQNTKDTIERNGTDVKNYSEYDKSVLMTCVNFAYAMQEIINIPVVDENGEISRTAEKMIVDGEQKIKEISSIMNS